MGRPRKTEEEKKARAKEYNRLYHLRRVSTEEGRKAYNAKRLEQYHDKMQDSEAREKERERSRDRYVNRTEEQKERDRARHNQYNREDRAMKRELGIPLLTPEQRKAKSKRQAERNKERYHKDKAYRKRVLKAQRDAYRKRKERLEEEGYQRRLELSRQAREILNY